MDGYWLMFVFGAAFGVLMASWVSDLVFPPITREEDDET